MGMFRIEMAGSFQGIARNFSAMENGHASAVAEAIAWLSGEQMQKAIRQDHDLHERGDKPSGPFGRV